MGEETDHDGECGGRRGEREEAESRGDSIEVDDWSCDTRKIVDSLLGAEQGGRGEHYWAQILDGERAATMRRALSRGRSSVTTAVRM